MALITDYFGLICVLIFVPTLIFVAEKNTKIEKFFTIVPSILFAYFIPTLLSNFDLLPGVDFTIIPKDAPVYKDIKAYILPASLILITLSVDIKGIIKLGPKSVIMFLTATLGVIVGAWISLAIWQSVLPEDVWKGMAALSGSWIGGAVNFIAVGNAVGASDNLMSAMVVVDVFIGQIWTAFLFYLAARSALIDNYFKADTSAIETLKERILEFQNKTKRFITTSDILVLFSIAFGGTWICGELAKLTPQLPANGEIISTGTWKIIYVSTFAVILSFTKIRNLEGVGASKFGAFFLYILIAVIGANASLIEVFNQPYLILMGLSWMLIHGLVLFAVLKWIKSPVFFLAVGSQANIGGAASAPIVASAFHPALATVGVMLGTAGYVLGTYCALLCAAVLKIIYFW